MFRFATVVMWLLFVPVAAIQYYRGIEAGEDATLEWVWREGFANHPRGRQVIIAVKGPKNQPGVLMVDTFPTTGKYLASYKEVSIQTEVDIEITHRLRPNWEK